MGPPQTPQPLHRSFRVSGGRFATVDAQLGRSLNASVYSGRIANGDGSDRRVAIKVFDSPADGREAAVQQLSAIARAAASFVHPRIVRTIDFNVTGEHPIIVNELVDGGSLDSVMRFFAEQGERLPHDAATLIGVATAKGVQAALGATGPHGDSVGMVHGGISPRNVLLSWEGEAKVADFGVGRLALGPSGLQSREAALYRLVYAAPEVARGEVADERSDVFSIGVLLHELLAGPRFAPGITLEQAQKLAFEGVIQQRLSEPAIHSALRSLMRKAVEPHPMRRYAHAGELAHELSKLAILLGIREDAAPVKRIVEAALTPDLEDVEVDVSSLTPSALAIALSLS